MYTGREVKIMKTTTTKTRITTVFLAVVMLITAIPMNAFASAERFPYAIFAASSVSGAVTSTAASNFVINGSVATNGTFVFANQPNGGGNRVEHANEPIIRIGRRIVDTYFSGDNVEQRSGDFTFSNQNINRNSPLVVSGTLELTGNITLNSSVMASGNIVLNGEVINQNSNIVIFSEHGDIIISNHNNVNFGNALIYAPNGNVVINSNNVNINGVVIAQTVTLDSPNVNVNLRSNVAEFVGIVSEEDDIPEPLGNCLFGGTIAPPTDLGNGSIRIANGNGLAGASGNEATRRVLNVDVLDLIEGTAIKASDIYGIAVVTWGPNTENRQAFISVNGVDSPMFHGSSNYSSDRIWAIMACGNTPNSVSRTEENRLVYMNKYSGNPQIASNTAELRPFMNSGEHERFDVQVRANNDHFAIVTEVLLLSKDGGTLGGAIFSQERNEWFPLMSFAGECGVCDSCQVSVDNDAVFSYTINNGVATVVGFANDVYPRNVVIPDNVVVDGVSYRVTQIGDFAFEGATMTSVTIPGTVTNIGWGAFASTTLESVVFAPNMILNARCNDCSIDGNGEEKVCEFCILLFNVRVRYAAFANNMKLTSVDFGGRSVDLSIGVFAATPNITTILNYANVNFENSGFVLNSGSNNEPGDLPGSGFLDDDELEYRITTSAVYNSTSREITVSWDAVMQIETFEMPITKGRFEVWGSNDGVNYSRLATVNDRTNYRIQTDENDFVVRYFRVAWRVDTDITARSNSCYVVWSPAGVCWTQYMRTWELSDNDFPRINTTDNPFALSASFDAAGIPSLHLRTGESGFSNAMRNNMIQGIIPELTYHEGLRVENVTLRFEIQEQINPARGVLEGHSEFDGINRLNVFKWFDEVNMSLPILTEVDISNNVVYTVAESFGSFAVVDMDDWFTFLAEQSEECVFVATNWNAMVLSADFSPDSDNNTDTNGLRWVADDVLSLINNGIITKLPTIESVVEFVSDREVLQNFRVNFTVSEALDSLVMPVHFDPTRSDTAGDEISNLDKLRILPHHDVNCPRGIQSRYNRIIRGEGACNDGCRPGILERYGLEIFMEEDRDLTPFYLSESEFNHIHECENIECESCVRIKPMLIFTNYRAYLDFYIDYEHYIDRLRKSFRFMGDDDITINPFFKLTAETMFPEFRDAENQNNLPTNAIHYIINGNNITMQVGVKFDYCEKFNFDETLINETLLREEPNGLSSLSSRVFENKKQLIISGIEDHWSGCFEGDVFDFFPGMIIEVVVEVEQRVVEDGAFFIRISGKGSHAFSCDASSVGRGFVMECALLQGKECPCQLHNDTVSGRIAAHEFGHILAIGDAYPNRYGFANIPKNEILGEMSLMWKHWLGEVVANDIEMALFSAVNEFGQEAYVPATNCRNFSVAIREKQLFRVYHEESGIPVRGFAYCANTVYRWDFGKETFFPLNAEIKTSGDWVYYTLNGSTTIVGYRGSDETVLIPDSLGGAVVTKIGSAAFNGKTTVTSITIPNTVTHIGNYAFKGTQLTTVTIPASVQNMGNQVFNECRTLRAIIFKGETPRIERNRLINNHVGTNRNFSLRAIYVPIGAETEYRANLQFRNDDGTNNNNFARLVRGVLFDNQGNPMVFGDRIIRVCDDCKLLEDDCFCCDECDPCVCCETCETIICQCCKEKGCEFVCICCDKCETEDYKQLCFCRCDTCGEFVCTCCLFCKRPNTEGHRCPGNITGDIGNKPEIGCALQILRFVISLPNILDPNNPSSDFCPEIVEFVWQAALIVPNSEIDCNHTTDDCECTPQIEDSLQILRWVIGLRADYLEMIWGERP
jgi:hypothetical protein